MVNGTLISFEGPEGAGKSSVLEAVLPLLEEKGIPFITTREPGGVDIAGPCSWENRLDGPLY